LSASVTLLSRVAAGPAGRLGALIRWERLPPVITRPALRALLGVLGLGLGLASRVSASVGAQVTRSLSFEIRTEDGVCRRWSFDGPRRRIASTATPTGAPDHRVCFSSSGQALGVLCSPRAVDALVARLIRGEVHLEGSAFIVLWFYGLTRKLVKIGRTRGPRGPVPGAYLRPDPTRDGSETIVREPAVHELDPAWAEAWAARAKLYIVRGPSGEPMPEP
jgi:hypothetical protein